MTRQELIVSKFSRASSAPWAKFKSVVDSTLKLTPNVKRLDCLNPGHAIPHNFDFSIVPSISIRQAWKQFLGLSFDNPLFTLGIRDSLMILFERIKTSFIALPADVYPVYQQIACEAGRHHPAYKTPNHQTDLYFTEYSTLPSFDIKSALNAGADVVLLTFPLYGRDITKAEVNCLLEWLKESPKRLIIMDRVYDYLRTNPYIQNLIDTDQAIICYSLTKTFLSPLLLGLTILPKNHEVLPHTAPTENINQGKVLLTRYSKFPNQQNDRFKYRWKQIGLPAPETGYLSVVPQHYNTLLADKMLTIAGSVFGSHDNTSIASCLHETNSFDDMKLVDRYYVTVLSNFARGYDKYSRQYSKENITESTFKDQFYLTDYDNLAVGFSKATHLLDAKNFRRDSKNERLIILKTRVYNYELHHSANGKGQFINRNHIVVDEVLDSNLHPTNAEDLYAQSLKINHSLASWNDIKPRSFSILPIAKSCQARCDFCFSHSSVSEDQLQGDFLFSFTKGCEHAVKRGAERLVITGGGEPTMLKHKKLLNLMSIGRQFFNKITMITNGYNIGTATPSVALSILQDYQAHGLTTLSVSRHGAYNNEEIMHLETHSELIALLLSENKEKFKDLNMRWVCVLQKQGVRDERTLAEYLNWVVDTKVSEVCFKELYVVSMSESVYSDSNYNKWCAKNQVSMSMLTNFLKWNDAKEVDRLPWGSPIVMLNWKGVPLKIAVYTEPSVFWERTHGVCRSWNLMADGTCYANLETRGSLIDLQQPTH